jgi:hypothetical protein
MQRTRTTLYRARTCRTCGELGFSGAW